MYKQKGWANIAPLPAGKVQVIFLEREKMPKEMLVPRSTAQVYSCFGTAPSIVKEAEILDHDIKLSTNPFLCVTFSRVAVAVLATGSGLWA